MSGSIRELMQAGFWLLLIALLPSVASAQATPITVDNVCTASGPGSSPPAAGTPFTPGRWWNPERSGTGWDIHFSDIGDDGRRTLAMVWFSYDTSGRPTWFVTSGPLDPVSNQWSGDLYSATWDFAQNRRTSLAKKGTIQLRFQAADATRIGLQWQLDSLGPQAQPPECIRDFGVSIQHPNRGDDPGEAIVNAAFSGMWAAETLDANPGQFVQYWSLFQTILPMTVNQSTLYRESAVIATYDDNGYPVWLDATDYESQPSSSMALDVERTLNFVYYYVTSEQYPNGVPNTPCSGGSVIPCSRLGHNLVNSDWKRVFNSPAIGQGRPVIQVAAAPHTGQGVTRLLGPNTPISRLRKITAVNQILVDRVECPVAGQAGCPLTVSWTSSLPWATIHREVQTGSTPGATANAQLSTGVHGAQVDNLKSGAKVRYVLRDNGGRVLHLTPEVTAIVASPLRFIATQAPVLSSTAPSTVRLSANVAGGIAPVQVEYFADGRSLGISKDTAPQLEWLDVGPGSYNVTFRATDSDNPPSTVEVTTVVNIATPSPAAAAVPDLESDRVGSSAGSFRVDESGAATYALPLTLPPGRAGVAPSLGLQYSSQAGEGSIGRGWSLSGLSNIMRCRQTREAGDFEPKVGEPSETPSGIRFDASDRFCLDGQRLVPAARTTQCPSLTGYQSDELRTEIDSFQRICAYTPTSGSASNNGPRAFSIEGKDGSRRWYGDHNGQEALLSLSLRKTAAAESPVYLWALNRTQDSVGNYVDYRYLVDYYTGTQPNVFPESLPGALLVNSIRYAGRISPAAAPHSEVRFNYGTTERTDRFVAGRAFINTQRLTSIDVLDQGAVLRHYALNYEGSSPSEFAFDGRQKSLKSIQECTAPTTNGVAPSGHTCLTPTVFDYGALDAPFGSPQPGFMIETGSTSKFEGQRIADIDGDGLSDIVWVKDLPQGEQCSVQTGLYGTDIISVSFLHRNNGVVAFKTTTALCTQVELMNRTWEHGTPPDEAWFLYDYDRDGKTDLFYRGQGKWIGHPATGDRGQPFDTSIDLLQTLRIPAGDNTKHFPRPMDLNGDGLMDLVRFAPIGDGTLPIDPGTGVASKADPICPGFVCADPSRPRLLAHLHQTTRDPSKPAEPGWSEPIEVTYSDPCVGAELNNCSARLMGLYDEDSFEQQVDKNGDGVADLHLLFEVTGNWPTGGGGGPGGPGNPGWPSIRPFAVEPTTALSTYEVVVVMRTVRVGMAGIELVHEPGLFMRTQNNKTRYADLNNDGLTDSYTLAHGPFPPSYSLNTGAGSSFGSMRCESDGERAYDDPSGIADVNGDGILDYYSYHTDGHSLRVYPGRAGLARTRGDILNCWSLFDTKPMQMGSNTSNFATWDQTHVEPKKRNLLFGDWDGDGLGDLLVMVALSRFLWETAGQAGLVAAVSQGFEGRCLSLPQTR